MNRIIYLFLLLSCVFLINCKKKTEIYKNTDFIFIPQNMINTIKEIAYDDSRFIDSCSFIPLETSDLGLIGEVTQIQSYNNKFYIYDQKTQKLKVFDSDGTFLFNIGSKGEGAGEYFSINSFFINEEENKIGIFDPIKLAVHEYNLNGKYIQTVKHNQNALISIRKSICSNEYIYCSLDVSFVNDMTYSVLSTKDYSIIDRWSPYLVKINQEAAAALIKHPFNLINDELHYLSLYSDTIYSYRNGQKQPYLLIETGKPNIPPTYFEGKPYQNDPMEAFFEVWKDKRYSPGFDTFFETDRYAVLSFSPNTEYYFIDKDTKEAFYVENRTFPRFMLPTLVDKNKLITVFNQQEIFYYQDYIKSNNLEYPKQIRELMSKYDVDEDNPILIIYHMKKSEK